MTALDVAYDETLGAVVAFERLLRRQSVRCAAKVRSGWDMVRETYEDFCQTRSKPQQNKMKKLVLIAAITLGAMFAAQAEDDLPTKLQNLSVTIHSAAGQGSGTVVTRGGMNFVLTAAHVVQDNRSAVEVIDESGRARYEVKFTPVTIVREIYVDSRSVGQTSVEGEIIAYSSAEYGHDLALLKLRYQISTDSTTFFKDKIAPVGSDLIHVGSLLGQEGSNSVTFGAVSQIGRTIDDRVYDQTSCAAFPGSSGGGIFMKSSGDYVGTLTRGVRNGDNFNFFVPVRRIRDWAKIHHLEFLFDASAVPDLSKVRLEDKEPIEKKAGDSENGTFTWLGVRK